MTPRLEFLRIVFRARADSLVLIVWKFDIAPCQKWRRQKERSCGRCGEGVARQNFSLAPACCLDPFVRGSSRILLVLCLIPGVLQLVSVGNRPLCSLFISGGGPADQQ